jgi:hypothetical protein
MANPLEEFRKEIFDIMEGLVMAEREACAKVAEQHVRRGSTGKHAEQLIADEIRRRPPFKLPPMALSLKDLLAPREGGKSA